MAAIKQMEDEGKAKKSRRRLLHDLLTRFADGSVRIPAEAAREFLTILPQPRKPEGFERENSMPDTANAGKSVADQTERKKKKEKLSVAVIGRRVAAIKQVDERGKAANQRRRLLLGLLNGIADGSLEDPAGAAREFLTLSARKPAAEAGDQ